jgi:hypothetical protein
MVRTVEPVEPIGAEQDEVNQQTQNEQEYAQSDKNTPRIE